MLEIIAVAFLAHKAYTMAKEKGYKGGGYAALTVALWVGGEILGAIIGAIITGGEEAVLIYLFAIIGAIIGGVIAYQIAKNLKDKSYLNPGPSPYQDGYRGSYYGQRQAPAQQNMFEVTPAGAARPAQAASAFQRYEGSGVCDVCNRSIGPGSAYLVPVNTFYSSRKYKEWLKNNPMTQMMIQSSGGVDAYLAGMRSMDHTSHSAVCSECVHLFE